MGSGSAVAGGLPRPCSLASNGSLAPQFWRGLGSILPTDSPSPSLLRGKPLCQ